MKPVILLKQYVLRKIKVHKQCCLEPPVLVISLAPKQTMVYVVLILDETAVGYFKYERSNLIKCLETEMEKLIPLCVDPHWTRENWCHE